MIIRSYLCLFLIFFPGILIAGEPDATATKEIAHLFEYLSSSSCEFYRNGSWYNVDRAVAHLDEKYKYLSWRGLINSAEDFIDKAATNSSMSGEPYLVKCGNDSPVSSNDWFKEELARYRKSIK